MTFLLHKVSIMTGLTAVSLVICQGLLTSGYIILLSRVGERVAADMRKTLFASLLRYKVTRKQSKCNSLRPIVLQLFSSFVPRQDVAFFDANKTGLLVNRLTADIQEFKSSFKLVISQVRGSMLSLCSGVANSKFSTAQNPVSMLAGPS